MISAKDKQEATDCLSLLQADIESQLLFLEGDSDGTWDTKDHSNWEMMHEMTVRIARLLKLDTI